MLGGYGRSTEKWFWSTVEGECRSTSRCYCRSMWYVCFCGWCVLEVHDLKEKCMFLVASGTAEHAPERKENFLLVFASNKNLD